MASASTLPIHKIGLIADIQHADAEDGFNYSKTNKRFFRGALQHLRKAVSVWRAEGVDRVFQLGDLIDGRCLRNGTRDADFARAWDIVDSFPVPWHHCVGNHELYNFKLDELASRIDVGEGNFYGWFPLVPGFRCVVLNTYDLSVLGRSEQDPVFRVAMDILNAKNPNQGKTDPDGLVGLQRRWVSFNGGLGENQLAWLDATLRDAKCKEERVILISHGPIHPSSCDGLNLLWDSEEALEILRYHRGVVIAAFAGHDHQGGSHFDEELNAVFVTFHGCIEVPLESEAYGICELYPDKLVLDGRGLTPSFTVRF